MTLDGMEKRYGPEWGLAEYKNQKRSGALLGFLWGLTFEIISLGMIMGILWVIR
jgi:hypothetical protein